MNKINKQNIEAYLLDFAEGNLREEEKQKVLLFLEENTEYKIMLSLYDKNFVLTEDKKIVFDNKDSLKHKLPFNYRKRLIYISSCAVAVLFLLFLLKPIKNDISNNCDYKKTVAKQNKAEIRK